MRAFFSCANAENLLPRLLTWNVHRCVGRDGKCSPERIARIIAEQNPDIVALQELDVRRSRTGRVGKYITYAAGVSSIVGAYVWDMVKIELGKHWPCAPPIHTPHAGLARAYDESMHGESRAAPPASRLRYILAYFLVFGCAGLAYEFWRLKGGRPPMPLEI